jgi:hypothetical protein
MLVNILVVVFSVAFIAVGVFAVFQMVRNSKKRGSKK